jgi:hypothetical protein
VHSRRFPCPWDSFYSLTRLPSSIHAQKILRIPHHYILGRLNALREHPDAGRVLSCLRATVRSPGVSLRGDLTARVLTF